MRSINVNEMNKNQALMAVLGALGSAENSVDKFIYDTEYGVSETRDFLKKYLEERNEGETDIVIVHKSVEDGIPMVYYKDHKIPLMHIVGGTLAVFEKAANDDNYTGDSRELAREALDNFYDAMEELEENDSCHGINGKEYIYDIGEGHPFDIGYVCGFSNPFANIVVIFVNEAPTPEMRAELVSHHNEWKEDIKALTETDDTVNAIVRLWENMDLTNPYDTLVNFTRFMYYRTIEEGIDDSRVVHDFMKELISAKYLPSLNWKTHVNIVFKSGRLHIYDWIDDNIVATVEVAVLKRYFDEFYEDWLGGYDDELDPYIYDSFNDAIDVYKMSSGANIVRAVDDDDSIEYVLHGVRDYMEHISKEEDE